MDDVKKIHEVPNIFGPSKTGQTLIVDGYSIPNVVVHDCGARVEFVLDERMSYSVPKEQSYLFASAIANALAIGAGYPHFMHPKKTIFATEAKIVGIE